MQRPRVNENGLFEAGVPYPAASSQPFAGFRQAPTPSGFTLPEGIGGRNPTFFPGGDRWWEDPGGARSIGLLDALGAVERAAQFFNPLTRAQDLGVMIGRALGGQGTAADIPGYVRQPARLIGDPLNLAGIGIGTAAPRLAARLPGVLAVPVRALGAADVALTRAGDLPFQVAAEVARGGVRAGRAAVPRLGRGLEQAAEALAPIGRRVIPAGMVGGPEQAARAAGQGVLGEPPPANLWDDLTDLVRQAEPLREQLTEAQRAARGVRTRLGVEALEGGEGTEAFRQARAALGGQLARRDFAPLRVLTPQAQNEMATAIQRAPGMAFYNKIRAESALRQVIAGVIPQPGDLELLGRVAGPGFLEAIEAMGPTPRWAWLAEVMNLPRVAIASWDVSAPLRQGVVFSVAHPGRFLEANAAMLHAMVSPAYARRVEDALLTRPGYAVAQQAGLYLAPLEAALGRGMTRREELFMSRLLQGLPDLIQRLPPALRTPAAVATLPVRLFGQGVAASERAYVTFLNKFRADVFDDLTRRLAVDAVTGQPRAESLEQLARFVNVATGRGSLPRVSFRGQDVTGVLAGTFFAPRFAISRFELPVALAQASPEVRRIMMQDLAKFIGAGAGVLALLSLAPDVSVELDPRSAAFGRVTVGSRTFDFWGGFQPVVRTLAQMVTGQRRALSSGQVSGVSPLETAERFVRGKLAPVPGAGVDVLEGRTITGQDVEFGGSSESNPLLGLFTPIFFQDLIDAVQRDGLLGAALVGPPSALGVGVTQLSAEGDVQRRMREGGWFRRQEAAWQIARSQHPNVPEGSYTAWRAAAVERVERALRESLPQGVAHDQALRIVDGSAPARAYRQALQQLTRRWIGDHGALAEEASRTGAIDLAAEDYPAVLAGAR